MALSRAFQSIATSAVKYVLMPVLLVGGGAILASMAPVKPKTEKTAKQNDLRRIDERYSLRRMTIRFDDRTGFYDVQLSGYSPGGDSTGTGKPTQMFLGFHARPGAPENVRGNSTVIKVNEIKFAYNPNYGDGTSHQAFVSLDLEPNYSGNNKSVFTVTPQDDPMTDPEKNLPFEVRKQHYQGDIQLNMTDMQGRALQNPRAAANEIKGRSVLGTPVLFKQNFFNQNNFKRTVLLGDGQSRTNYFPEDMQLTGAQVKLDNN